MKKETSSPNRLTAIIPLICLMVGMGAAVQGATWSFTNSASTVWNQANNWTPNSVPPLGVENYPGRFNVCAASPAHATNCTLIYDSPLTTAFGTVVNAAPEFGRGLSVANGSGTVGTLRIVNGTLKVYQAALIDAVIVCAPANATTSVQSQGYLTLDGGNLTVVATNYGIVSCPARGGADSLGVLTVQNGSTLTVDRIRFGSPLLFNDLGTNLPGILNLNAGGTLQIRNMANTRPDHVRATNNFNGGTIKVLGSETLDEGRNPLIGSNIVNNILAGGLVVDTAGHEARIVSPLLNGTGGADGGLTKTGNGILNLRGQGSTYTGATVVNAGTLGVQVPMTSTTLQVASGANLNFITDNTAPWVVPSLGVTNATLGFDYGVFAGYNDAVVAVNNLDLRGTIKVNLLGTSLPVTNLTLLTYVNKTGTGSFSLGTLPTGASATLVDTGSALVLQITSASIQTLVWSYGDGIWQKNGGLNWNNYSATYLEYPSGVGDIVIFDEGGAFGPVTIAGVVKPSSISVDATLGYYAFTGSGSISGATGIEKAGSSTLQIGTSNDFTGVVTVGAGTLFAEHPKALGATNGGTVVNPGATLEVGAAFGNGVTVSGETVTISGSGIGGALGALRGSSTSSGNNVWDGPVILGQDLSRIGTEESGNLTVSGPIKAEFPNIGLLIRPGANSTVTLSGGGSSYAYTRTYGDQSGTGIVKIGANDALSTNRLDLGLGPVDLNGFNQTVGGITDVAGPGTILNNGGVVSTLTINTGTNNFGTAGDIADGASPVSVIKLGTGQQSLYGANLSYSGATTISQGRLNLYSTNTLNTSITLAGGAALDGEFTTAGSVTLSANSTLYVNPSTAEALTANSVNATAGPVHVEFTAGFPGVVAVLVLKSTTPINGLPSNFQAGGRGGTFTLGAGNTELYFTPSSLPNLVWAGNDATNPSFWDTQVTTNWLNSGAPDVFVIGDNVLFNDTASTFSVEIQSTVIPSTVAFNNSISDYSVSGVIGGSATVSKSGSATVTLSGNNSYSGATTISAGTVVAGNGNALGDKTGSTSVSGTGTLDLNGQNLGAEEVTISGAGFGGNGTVVNSGAEQINALQRLVLAGNATIGGARRWDLRGTGNYLDMGGYTLTKAGSNYIALVDTFFTNTPGNIIVQGGTFAIQLNANIGGSSLNTLTVQSGAILNNYSTTGPQLWTLVMQDGSSYQVNNGSASQNIWGGPITVNGAATLEVNAFLTMSGDIAGTGSITKTGGGLVTFSGFNNTYNGATTINAGRLAIEGVLSTSPVLVNNGGTLTGLGTVGGAVTVANNGKVVPGSEGVGTLTVGALALQAGALADFELLDSFTLDRVAVTTSGGLTLNGGGINLFNAGANTAFTANGTYTLFTYSGTLNGSVTNLAVLNAQPGKTYVFSANGTEVQVTIGDAPNPIYWGVDNNGSWVLAGNWNPATVPNAQFVSANFGGVGSPAFSAPRTVTLDGGGTVGALVFDSTQPFTVNQGSSGSIQLDNGAGVALITETTGNHTINAPLALPLQGVGVSVANATTLSLNGGMSGSGGVSKSTAGTLVLGGANTYSGATAVSAGTLVVSNNAALGATAGATIISSGGSANAARVELAHGVTVTGESITINGYGQNVRGSLQAGSGATAEWAGPVILGAGASGDQNRVGAQANGTLKISGPIMDGGINALYISADGATGKVIASGPNTYSGQTAIIRGTLQLGAHNSLPAGSVLNVHSAAGVSDRSVFDLAGYNQQVGGLLRGSTSGPGLVTNSSLALATLTISNTAAYTYNQPIAGPLALVMTGSGTQTLSGVNAYTGDTIVDAGTLVISQATLNTNSLISVASNAVLQLNFAGINQVAALVLDGVSQAPGVYDSSTAAPYIAGTGSLEVPSVVPPAPTITYTVSGGQITLTWPIAYTGWYLQSQTNALNTGLANNWATVSGSESVNEVTLPITTINPAVFFRMVYTNAP